MRRINQTPDGYLWLATRDGLVHFDGVRFSTFRASSGEGLESSTTQHLVIDPDGSIWVATFGGGIAHYQAGKFHSYLSRDGLPSDDIESIYRDSQGTLWVGTHVPAGFLTETLRPPSGNAGIARMVHGRFETLSLGIPSSSITAFLEGEDHSLWIAAFGYGVFRVQNGVLTSFSIKEGLPDKRVSGLYRDRSGKIWTAGWRGISFWNGTRFVGHPGINAVVSYATTCTEDRDGNLWIASSSGLFRARAGEVSKMDRSSGLSGDFVSDVFEDREGNLWVGTRAGLDRLRDTQVRTFTNREGLLGDTGPGETAPIVADEKGAVWRVSSKHLVRIAANNISAWPMTLPNGSTPFTLLPIPDAGFLIGFDNVARSWTGGQVRLATEFSGLDVRALLRGRDGSIWIGTANRGLLRWTSSAESQTLTETGVSDRSISTLAEDRSGVIWAGSANGGGVYRVAGQQVRHFGRSEGLGSANIYTIFADGKGEIWIGSTGGLSWFQEGQIHTVNSQRGLPGDQVFEILDDSYDRLWFLGYGGVAAVEKKSLAEWGAGSRQRLRPMLYRGGQVYTVGIVFPDAVRSTDEHLWFSIAGGLLEVTPPNPAAAHGSDFPVLIEDVTIDGVVHSEQDRIRIPQGARSIELRYTALTLSNSEAVRFRYRLEGFDNDWVDADTRRLAFYNNLRPGDYKFWVAASAGEEQWQESSALVLEQLPFFYQTWWFMLLGSATALSLAYFVYRLRVYQIARELNVRLEERVSERTRLARDLHDTLLQSFHGLMLRFQVVSKLMPEGKAKEQLEKALERADQAIAEGRSAVYDLRSSATTTNELSEALNAVGNELSTEGAAEFGLVVEGPRRDLHPIIGDELYRISRETLRNAFKHARARHIEAEIRYGERVFRLRIRDDGEGIPAEILEQGRPGHYGLRNTRTRPTSRRRFDHLEPRRLRYRDRIEPGRFDRVRNGAAPVTSKRIFGKKVG